MCTASGPAIERNKPPSETSSASGFYAPDAHSSPPSPLPPPPRNLAVVIVPCGLINICHILLRRKCDIFLNELVHWKLDAASSIVEAAEVRADGLVEFIQPAWREMENSRLLTVGLRVEFSKFGLML